MIDESTSQLIRERGKYLCEYFDTPTPKGDGILKKLLP